MYSRFQSAAEAGLDRSNVVPMIEASRWLAGCDMEMRKKGGLPRLRQKLHNSPLTCSNMERSRRS